MAGRWRRRYGGGACAQTMIHDSAAFDPGSDCYVCFASKRVCNPGLSVVVTVTNVSLSSPLLWVCVSMCVRQRPDIFSHAEDR
jgi:hypothetical protein